VTRTYRAAIIGCGDIGHAHAQGYLLNPEVELVAVVDPLELASRQFQAEYDIPESYSSVEEMLPAARPDLVSVCVWHLLHAPMTIAAAEAGVTAVICEKPMAIGMGEADAMIAACERSATKLIVSHQRRFTPGWELARALVAAGEIGDVRMTHGRGTAGLLNVGTHIIDAMLFILGDPAPVWVMGAVERQTDRFERDTPIEDGCMVLAELEGGAQILVQSELHPRGEGPGLMLRFEGADGVIEAAEGIVRLFNAASGGWREVMRDDDVDTIGGQANGRQVAELIQWIEGGPEHRGSARLARRTMEIMMAAYESARRHRVIRLPLEETGYPLGLMIDEGALPPNMEGAYDIRSFLRRDDVDEGRYADLRADGIGHHQIMLRLDAEKRR
jgi:predicted dehydrogenase